jgi:hypothetical protein
MKILLPIKQNRILLFIILSVCGIVVCRCQGTGGMKSSLPQKASVEAAETAWMQMSLDLSRKNLEKVWEDNRSSVEDRVKAAQMLAIQNWKFLRDYAAASDRIKQADALGIKQSLTWQTMSRIARENGHFSDARDAAIKAIEAAESESEKSESLILLADAIHDQAINMLHSGQKPDRDSLDEAGRLLTAVLAEEPGRPVASKILFGISLLRRDGPGALKAWHNFFLVPENEAAPGLPAEPGRALNRILPKWQGQVLSVENQESLILAVAASRFYEYTALLAADLETRPGYNIENHPGMKEVVLYAGFIKKIKQITDEYYRQVAINNSSSGRSRLEKNYRESYWREAESFWTELPFDGKRPRFRQKLFEQEISRRFGTTVNMGSSGNYSGFMLFMGHRIVDDTIEVKQYGRKAKLRYIVLESMASDGYSGWFWDGKAAPGGWGTGTAIVQVREAYLGEPFASWRMITDPKVRSETEKLISKETARDDVLARENPYAYLPGLRRRLQFNAVERIYASMKAKGYKGAELCIAFVAEYLRLKVESTVYAHEGRHAIDQRFYPDEFKHWTDEREFRAKLSQIVFTSDPKFTIASGGIMDGNIGSNTQHGKANERIMKTIVQWMRKHIAEIPGINAARPLLPQFDLLSDDQIKAIFIEVDPMAANASGYRKPSLGEQVG